MKIDCFILVFGLLFISGCGCSSCSVYDYTLAFYGAEVPDMNTCQVIHWESEKKLVGSPNHDFGYEFLYEVLKENKINASLTTDELCGAYGRRFDSVLKYIPERFEFNVAEICKSLNVDKVNPSHTDFLSMEGLWGGFNRASPGLQAKIAVRGFVYERTYGSKGVVRMVVEYVRERKLGLHPKAGIPCRMLELVERVYSFYNDEGTRFATLRVKMPHSFFGYDYGQGVVASRKAVSLALKEFGKRDGMKRTVTGHIEVSKLRLGDANL